MSPERPSLGYKFFLPSSAGVAFSVRDSVILRLLLRVFVPVRHGPLSDAVAAASLAHVPSPPGTPRATQARQRSVILRDTAPSGDTASAEKGRRPPRTTAVTQRVPERVPCGRTSRRPAQNAASEDTGRLGSPAGGLVPGDPTGP